MRRPPHSRLRRSNWRRHPALCREFLPLCALGRRLWGDAQAMLRLPGCSQCRRRLRAMVSEALLLGIVQGRHAMLLGRHPPGGASVVWARLRALGRRCATCGRAFACAGCCSDASEDASPRRSRWEAGWVVCRSALPAPGEIVIFDPSDGVRLALDLLGCLREL